MMRGLVVMVEAVRGGFVRARTGAGQHDNGLVAWKRRDEGVVSCAIESACTPAQRCARLTLVRSIEIGIIDQNGLRLARSTDVDCSHIVARDGDRTTRVIAVRVVVVMRVVRRVVT